MRIDVTGFWLGYPEYRSSPKLNEYSMQAGRLVAEGKLKVPVAGVYSVSEAREALTHAMKGGKVLFKPT